MTPEKKNAHGANRERSDANASDDEATKPTEYRPAVTFLSRVPDQAGRTHA